jgi:hypothetical protein
MPYAGRFPPPSTIGEKTTPTSLSATKAARVRRQDYLSKNFRAQWLLLGRRSGMCAAGRQKSDQLGDQHAISESNQDHRSVADWPFSVCASCGVGAGA